MNQDTVMREERSSVEKSVIRGRQIDRQTSTFSECHSLRKRHQRIVFGYCILGIASKLEHMEKSGRMSVTKIELEQEGFVSLFLETGRQNV